MPERSTRKRSEQSAEVVVAEVGEGPNEEESETRCGSQKQIASDVQATGAAARV
jgi:hypothetical protein